VNLVRLNKSQFCSTSTCWKKKKKDVSVFQDFPHQDPNMNPLIHKRLRKEKHDKSFKVKENSKLLKVSLIGTTNSGKSTLINKLIGHHVCPESTKPNTTRCNARAIITEGNTQIVFLDTPGVVDLKTATKEKMETSILMDPEKSCKDADLLVVLHDVSNRFVRESLNKKILRLMCLYNKHVPSVLVLNKMDTIPKSRRVYDLIRKLTCNRLDGVQSQVEKVSTDKMKTIDGYLKKKFSDEAGFNLTKIDEDDRLSEVTNIDELLEYTKNRRLTEDEVSKLTAGLIGWPGFKDVFTISALEGDGVDVLKQYLIASAKEASWIYPQGMTYDSDPREIVLNIVKSRFLEHLSGPTPYLLKPEISVWELDENLGKLTIVVDVEAKNKNIFHYLLGRKGTKSAKISKDIQETLINFFSHEVHFKIHVVPKFTIVIDKEEHSKSIEPHFLL